MTVKMLTEVLKHPFFGDLNSQERAYEINNAYVPDYFAITAIDGSARSSLDLSTLYNITVDHIDLSEEINPTLRIIAHNNPTPFQRARGMPEKSVYTIGVKTDDPEVYGPGSLNDFKRSSLKLLTDVIQLQPDRIEVKKKLTSM